MSQESRQPLIERLKKLNIQLDEEIQVINSSSADDYSDSLERLQSIKNEQTQIYNLLKDINANLYASFVSAKTLNDH